MLTHAVIEPRGCGTWLILVDLLIESESEKGGVEYFPDAWPDFSQRCWSLSSYRLRCPGNGSLNLAPRSVWGELVPAVRVADAAMVAARRFSVATR